MKYAVTKVSTSAKENGHFFCYINKEVGALLPAPLTVRSYEKHPTEETDKTINFS